MKGQTAVVVALVVCGTLCILAPWAYGAWYLHVVAGLLTSGASKSVTIPTLAHSSLSSWSLFLGALMIAAGVLGSILGQKSDR